MCKLCHEKYLDKLMKREKFQLPESHSPFDLPILVSSDLAFAHFLSASDLRVSMAARPLQIYNK